MGGMPDSNVRNIYKVGSSNSSLLPCHPSSLPSCLPSSLHPFVPHILSSLPAPFPYLSPACLLCLPCAPLPFHPSSLPSPFLPPSQMGHLPQLCTAIHTNESSSSQGPHSRTLMIITSSEMLQNIPCGLHPYFTHASECDSFFRSYSIAVCTAACTVCRCMGCSRTRHTLCGCTPTTTARCTA